MNKKDRQKLMNLKESSSKESDDIKEIKKRKGEILKREIEKQKEYISEDNSYREYILKNKFNISNKCGLNAIVENHDEAIGLLKTIDIRKFLGLDVKLNVPFESKLFNVYATEKGVCNTEDEAKEAIANIVMDVGGVISSDIKKTKLKRWTYSITYKAGNQLVYINTINNKYKLFFKRNKGVTTGREEESYDIINIYEMIRGINTYTAIKELCDMLNIKVKYCIRQEEKYNYNIKILNGDYLKDNYPVLYKYIKRYMYVLIELLEEGKENITTTRNSFDGENVFFCSGKYLNKKFMLKHEQGLCVKPKSQNQLSKIINLFCILGLIIKLKKIEVPEVLRKMPKKLQKESNYFIFKEYTDIIFTKAEETVIKLMNGKKRISAMQITGDICKEVLGEEIYINVYSNNEESTKKAQNTISYKKENKNIECSN